MDIQLIGNLDYELIAIGLKEGDIIRNVTGPQSNKAVNFEKHHGGYKYHCSVWPENYIVIEKSTIDFSNKACWFSIRVTLNREQLEFIKWDNLRMNTRMKWDWYFKYRAALLQVKYPKARVETAWGTEDAVGVTAEQLLAHRIKGKRATISKYKNRLSEYEKSWNSLFPIAEDLIYQDALKKIQRLENELNSIIKHN